VGEVAEAEKGLKLSLSDYFQYKNFLPTPAAPCGWTVGVSPLILMTCLACQSRAKEQEEARTDLDRTAAILMPPNVKSFWRPPLNTTGHRDMLIRCYKLAHNRAL
jgi:hypothetical protein